MYDSSSRHWQTPERWNMLQPEISFNIVVNGIGQMVHQEELSYDDVVKLAYGKASERIVSIMFTKAQHPKTEGILSPGGFVRVQDGTKISTAETNNA